MSDKPKHRKGVATQDFTDAGTGENYAAGEEYMIETGAHANFSTAGLIKAPERVAPVVTASAPRARAAKRKKGSAAATTPAATSEPPCDTSGSAA